MTGKINNGYLPTRRGFVKGMAVAAGTMVFAAKRSTAEPVPDAEKPQIIKRKSVKHIILFVHPPSKFSQNRLAKPNPVAEENWIKLVAEKGPNQTNAMCILRGSKPDKPLEEAGLRHFADRCFVGPLDDSEATRLIMLGDLNRTLGRRGNYDEWPPYEIWSSNNARRWAEGFKKQLAEKGYEYNPDTVTMETFGNWSGCHHKYSNYMAVYLGMKSPARIHAETELCSLKMVPMPVHEFVALEPMAEHVWLAVFRREDGVPMAQFWDGLRPVWQPPHVARVAMDTSKIDLFASAPNAFMRFNGDSKKLKGEFIADVGDGAHPAFTTVVGRSDKPSDFEELRTALRKAKIETRRTKRGVFLAVET